MSAFSLSLLQVNAFWMVIVSIEKCVIKKEKNSNRYFMIYNGFCFAKAFHIYLIWSSEQTHKTVSIFPYKTERNSLEVKQTTQLTHVIETRPEAWIQVFCLPIQFSFHHSMAPYLCGNVAISAASTKLFVPNVASLLVSEKRGKWENPGLEPSDPWDICFLQAGVCLLNELCWL